MIEGVDDQALRPSIEHVDVLVIGAGLSGVAAGYYLQTRSPWARYTILEGRDDLGGTWGFFRYPGLRSDSDMHTLGYSFRPWTGDDSIADGADILKYIRDTASTYGIDRHIRYGHRVVSADWSTPDACWHVVAERQLDDGAPQRVELTAGFLLSCAGYYRYDRGYEPDFADRDRFEGPIVHPHTWPDDLDVANRRVVVIGSGATALTLIPELARTAAHVTMLQRSPTYIASVPRRGSLPATMRRILPGPVGARLLRWLYAVRLQGLWVVSRQFPDVVRRVMLAGVRRELPDADIARDFTPRYDPWDQRLGIAADGDFFRAIREGRASVVTDHVDRFTPTGIALASGDELEADVVVTATGLELIFMGGVDVRVDGDPVDPGTHATYLGVMLEGVPNLAGVVGYANASWTLKAEMILDFVCRVINGMRATGMRQATPVDPDLELSEASLLPLEAGYIRRGIDVLPKQGGKDPWKVHQTFWQDRRALSRDPVEDPAMQLTNPSPATPPGDRFRGRAAAITGAGSGIGRAIAIDLARRGTDLALADIDDESLDETAATCRALGATVTTAHVDVADREAVFAWADRVVDEHGRVNLLFNNAGVAVIADIAHLATKDIEWLMGINYWGVVHGTQAFLPHLEASGEGHIVNVSSVFGLTPIPTQAAYTSAKFAVRAWSDCLRMELEIDGSCVSATTVHPGGIKTNIVRNTRLADGFDSNDARQAMAASFEKTAMTTPEKAAAQILRGVERNKRRVLVGLDAKFFNLASRLPVGLYQRIVIAGAKQRARAEQNAHV